MIESIRYFGNYLILGEIASGGMGVVYLAKQGNLNREVALKLIRSGAFASRREVEQFQFEAETASSLTHPNIVRIYESGEHEGQPFVAMEYIEGENLSEQLSSGRWAHAASGDVAEIRRAIELLSKLTGAVHYAHERGVIHRDLKPGNVLVDSKGEPFLTDFGLAKAIQREVGLTRTGQILGTPAYMSPEQAAGRSKEVTVATDVYALGAVLYALIAGRAPFSSPSDNAVEILKSVVSEEPRSPRRINRRLPEDLETICLKCLSKDPHARYSSALALQEDLDRWLRGEPITARSVSSWERGVKWAARHPVVAGLSAALAFSLVVGALAVLWQWRRAEDGWASSSASNVRLRLERAEDAFASDKSSVGLALLAQLLRESPRDAAVEERAMNALSCRRFLIPRNELASKKEVPDLDLSLDSQAAARIAKAGDLQAFVTPDGQVKVTSSRPDRAPPNLEGQTGGVVRAVTLSPDGRWLAAASSGESAKVWDLRTGAIVRQLQQGNPSSSLAFSPESQSLITGSDNGVLTVWSIPGFQTSAVEVAHEGAVNVVRFSPDGTSVATGGDDGTIRLWSSASLKAIAERASIGEPVRDLQFSSERPRLFVRIRGAHLLCFGWSDSVLEPSHSKQRFPLPALQALTNLWGWPATRFHAREITCVHESADGKWFATSSLDRSARIWRRADGSPLGDPLLHNAVVNGVQFSRDGERLVTTAADSSMRVWDVGRGLPVTDRIETRGPVFAGAFSEDRREVIASTEESWRLHMARSIPLSFLPELLEAVAGRRVLPNGTQQFLTRDDAAAIWGLVLRSHHADPEGLWLSRLLGEHASSAHPADKDANRKTP